MLLLLLLLLLASCSCAAHPVGFQNRTAISMFTEAQQKHINQILVEFMIKARKEAHTPQPRPSASSPFIFFHQRKAAGSSLRNSLHAAANRMNLSHYMPCFDGVECDDYALPKNARHAVNAGHFSWGETWKLARHNKLRGLQSRHNFTCLTTYREPVSRLISYLQFYHPDVFELRCFNTLTERELQSLLVGRLDFYG
jgi:hypothetical protein